MLEAMQNIAKMDMGLSEAEFSLFKFAVDKVLTSLTQKLRVAYSILDENKSDPLVKIRVATLEAEMRIWCEKIGNVLRQHLIPSSTILERLTSYEKMRADVSFYLCQIIEGNNLEKAISDTQLLYENAWSMATRHLNPANTLRISLVVNRSVFLWEMKNDRSEALQIATDALLLIMNEANCEGGKMALRHILSIWTSDDTDSD